MALIPIFEILNIVTYISVDKEKIKIIMICMHAHNYVNRNNQRYYGIEDAGQKFNQGGQ